MQEVNYVTLLINSLGNGSKFLGNIILSQTPRKIVVPFLTRLFFLFSSNTIRTQIQCFGFVYFFTNTLHSVIYGFVFQLQC